MSVAAPCRDHAAVSVERGRPSRLAGALRAVAGALERRAARMVRARVQRQAMRELSRLDDAKLYDIGLTRGEVDTVVHGLVGPEEFWRGRGRS